VGPRFGLNAVEKIKIMHCSESNVGSAARSPSLSRLQLIIKKYNNNNNNTTKNPISINYQKCAKENYPSM
jgi:hypothetical protein